MGILRGDTQHIYVDSISVNYHGYERQDGGEPMNGTGFAIVEFTKGGPLIRMLPGVQKVGESAVLPQALLDLVDLIARDAQRLRPFIDEDPFVKEEDEALDLD